MAIYMWRDPYEAMQGPCPTGFHVPSKDEWVSLCGAMTNLGITNNYTTMANYLFLPMSGYRDRSSGNTNSQGTVGNYWSATASNASNSLYLYFTSSNFYQYASGNNTYGCPVRAFKNTPTAPDNTWTNLYGTLTAGIYHNSTLSLISIVNGTTVITIADKNLGATQVYNNGDTLSEANCGYYYQWGNNYGFPFTGAVTTSSTRVDASAYGPGNYYNSSTFIIGTTGWSSVQNDNLWGGAN